MRNGVMVRGGREKGIIALLSAAVFWGSSIVIARIFLRQISPFVLSHLGACVSAVSILLPLLIFKRQSLRLYPRDWWRFVLLGGVAFTVGGLFINIGIQRTSAATAATLQYLAPAFTLIYGWLLRTEDVDKWKVLAVLLTLAGAACATGVVSGGFVFDPVGVAGSVGSAATFAFITIFSKTFASRYNPIAFTGYTFAAMAVAYTLVSPIETLSVVKEMPRTVLLVAAYAVFLGVIPTILYFYAMKWVAPTAATIVLSFEIVVTSVLGWLWLGERLSFLQIVGAIMVISAVIIIEQRRERSVGIEEGLPSS
jgi:DME family drug/metabolite transporter